MVTAFDFKIVNYLVIFTFFCIFLEFIYSYFNKDENYTVEGTLSNVVSAFIMKVFFGNISIFIYIGYLMMFKKHFPSIENISQYGLISYLLCFVVTDFAYYWWHRAQHYFDIFWVLHFVHHSDNKMNLSTSYRFSWIEKVFNVLLIVPAILIGFEPYFALLCFYLSSIYHFFVHSSYIKYPKYWDYILVTNDHHGVHHLHSKHEEYKNFSILFTFWDRIFGTYKRPSGGNNYGIKGYTQNNFLKVQIDPILDYIKKFYK